jgi:hypothetical protein
MQVASVKQSNICHGQGEAYYFGEPKDYDNNLVKDNCWEEIAGKLHAQDKELS